MAGKDMTTPSHDYSLMSRGHNHTLSEVSSTLSVISCATDISEVSNTSEEEMTHMENVEVIRVSLNSRSLSASSFQIENISLPRMESESDSKDFKDCLESQTKSEPNSPLLRETKDPVINTDTSVTSKSVRQHSDSCGPVSVIKLPVTKTVYSEGGEIVVLDKSGGEAGIESESETNSKIEDKPGQIMEKSPSRR